MSEPLLRLSKGATLALEGDCLIFYSDSCLKVEEFPTRAQAALSLLKDGCTRADMEPLFDDPVYLAQLLHLLLKTGFVIESPPSAYEGTPLERQAAYWFARRIDGNVAQIRLAAARVALLGIGGIGSVVLQHLAAAGVRNFSLIDGDSLQLHNLNRQFIYKARDVGRPKVLLAKAYLENRIAGATIAWHDEPILSAGDLDRALGFERIDLLVMAADYPAGVIRRIAANWCIHSGTAYLEGSCGLLEGAWGPLLEAAELPGYLEHLAKSGPVSPADVMEASFGPTNTLVAAFMAFDILCYLTGLPAHSRSQIVTLDFHRCRLNPVPLEMPHVEEH